MMMKLWETALSRRKSGFPQICDLNSRSSASCGDCSFSVDLTADLISAIGGNRRFVPFRESYKGQRLIFG